MEAQRLIESDGGSQGDKGRGAEERDNLLTLGDTEEGDTGDPFTTRLYSLQQDGGVFSPVVASRSVLASLGPGEVIVCRWPPPLRNTYYRNLMPDMAITKCETCNKVREEVTSPLLESNVRLYQVFHSDDYELQLLQKGHCPFCR